jgi:type IV pilus assembly protein PilM
VFSSDRILALDIGTSRLVLAEFLAPRGGVPQLVRYGIGAYDTGASGEADSSAYIVAALRQVLRETQIRPAPLHLSISGQAVFPRFVKLPPVARDKVQQIIRYEAEQNVPGSIDEVVWDHQVLGSAEPDRELDVMLVAVKTETVTRLTDCVLAAGLEPEIVDVAPLAVCNTVRFNDPEMRGCVMVLNIGARSTDLIFVEEDRLFNRTIPVAGNAITQEIAREFDVGAEEAEALKRRHAFVGLGGVYAGPEDEVADRVSRVVRNVFTRLHAEVNRSISFYRGQQGGSPPSRVLLCGGSSRIPHLDTFLREKLKADVEYLNPFERISVGPGVSNERVQEDMHLLAEVAGLSLRRSLSCPVEINLLPPALRARQDLRRRMPFFAVAAAGVVLTVLAWGLFFHVMSGVQSGWNSRLASRKEHGQDLDRRLDGAQKALDDAQRDFNAVAALVDQRTRWIEWIEALHACMPAEGLWLRSLAPEELDGRLHIRISGRAFEDLLQAASTNRASGVVGFLEGLRRHPLFAPETSITELPAPAVDAYARDFTIRVALSTNATGAAAAPAAGREGAP